MEKKKLLLVAVSVGVVLVIVIGASILVFSPAKPTGYQTTTAARPVPAGYSTPASVDPADMVRNAEGYQGLQTPPPSTTAFSETNIYINGETSDPGITFDQGTDETTKTQLVISVARPTAAAVPDAPSPLPAQPAAASSGTSTAVKQTAPAAAKPATAVPVPVKTTVPASNTTAAQGKVYDVYWVQTGSFSAKVRADGVRETLASKGINSVIENRDVNGATYYRVRVGPYTSPHEADYWLTLIKSIEGFEDSQVWKSLSRL
jgi:DedD protein